MKYYETPEMERIYFSVLEDLLVVSSLPDEEEYDDSDRDIDTDELF